MADYMYPNQAENALRGLQYNSLMKQDQMLGALKPYLYESYGLTKGEMTPDAQAEYEGLKPWLAYAQEQAQKYPWDNWGAEIAKIQSRMDKLSNPMRRMTEEEITANMTPLERTQYENSKLEASNYKSYMEKQQKLSDIQLETQQLGLERYKQALKGEIPIPAALERKIAEERGITEEALARRLGNNWRQSTPGVQTERAFGERADTIRNAVQTDALSSGQAGMLAMEGYLRPSVQSSYQAKNYSGLTNQYLPTIASYTGALSPYQSDRQTQMQMAMADEARSDQKSAGLMGGIGSLLGMAAGGMTGGMFGYGGMFGKALTK